MRHLLLLPACLLVGLLTVPAAPVPFSAVTPLPRAHAHNDYQHPRPLLDALACGFCSVEADIHLVDGQLLVAHDSHEIRADRTLDGSYLEPLRRLAREHGGTIHPHGPEFLLHIDIKTEAEGTYATLKPLLAAYRDILTEYGRDRVLTNAVTVILSGNRPWQTVASETTRYAAIDGRLPDLAAAHSVQLVPLISDNWRTHFEWSGQGPLSEVERARLIGLVDRAHVQGRRIRFWAIPDRPEAWSELLKAGVDLINTDDLAGLQAFLIGRNHPGGSAIEPAVPSP